MRASHRHALAALRNVVITLVKFLSFEGVVHVCRHFVLKFPKRCRVVER